MAKHPDGAHSASDIFELDFLDLTSGKNKIRAISDKKKWNLPSYKPVLEGRWRAEVAKWTESTNLDPELRKILQILIDICAEQNLIAEQREIYYAVRGKFPTLKVGKKKWADLYDTFLNNYMNKTQIAVEMPMQSFGVEAGMRGTIAGEGLLILEDGNRVSLSARPALRFEHVRSGVRYQGHARKQIHYEKEAGFSRLIAGDISQLIEAVFSTSQGYSSEAASKFLRDNEEREMKSYCLHDADPHGLQMQMMYGLASKNNCYMTDRFYPHHVIYLGLVPRVSQAIGLPPEKVDIEDRKIIPNLRILLQEKPDFLPDVDIIDKHNQKWEYQSLNAMHERAPQVYLIEALRAREDEIKHVPPASELKPNINDEVSQNVQRLVEENISGWADKFYQDNIRPRLIEQLKGKLVSDIDDFKTLMETELPKLDVFTDTSIREAVKLKLVENPRQFWETAARQVGRDMLSQKFAIEGEVDWNLEIVTAKAEKELEINPPVAPPQPLTKTDIVDSIQRRIITQKPQRDKVVNPIRKALEKVFGEPDETW